MNRTGYLEWPRNGCIVFACLDLQRTPKCRNCIVPIMRDDQVHLGIDRDKNIQAQELIVFTFWKQVLEQGTAVEGKLRRKWEEPPPK